MSELRKVWAVSSGEYSDYGVSFLIESEEEAQAIEEALKGLEQQSYGGYFVEEFDFYPTGEAPMPKITWRAWGKEGTMEVSVHPEISFTEDPPKRPETGYAPPWPRLAGSDYPGRFSARCGDRDAAIKSVKDRLAAAKTSLT